jgi:hypothetical protein
MSPDKMPESTDYVFQVVFLNIGSGSVEPGRGTLSQAFDGFGALLPASANRSGGAMQAVGCIVIQTVHLFHYAGRFFPKQGRHDTHR